MLNRFIILVTFTFFSQIASVQAFSNQSLFSIYNIETPFTISQPIIAANLIDNSDNNSADELLAIGVDDQKQTWLAIYVFDEKLENYQLYTKQIIPKKYFAYDLSDFVKKNKNKLRTLYFLAKDEVVTFKVLPSVDNTELLNRFEIKQKVDSMYLVKSADFINAKDFIKDLNQDGLDDIYLPHFEQMNLWLSQPCGQLHFQLLPLPSFIEHDNAKVTFNQRTLFFADFNFDAKTDIAWIKQGSIEYFSQTENGLFSPVSKTIMLNNTIYGLNWWNIREPDGDSLDQSKLAHRMVEQIKDVNGDGIVDMVVRFTQTEGVLDRRNDYEFYFGQSIKVGAINKITFPNKPSTTIQAEGTLTGLSIIDINNDNKFEVMLSSFELSLSNIIGALISGGIDQNVLLFSLNDQNIFEDKPITNKEVELSFSLSNGRSGQPIVQLADINGDGLQDLMLSEDDDTLKVYLGKKGKRKFAKRALKQELLLAKDGQYMQSHDINLDGKQDFIMSYTRLDEQKTLNTFTVLITN
ncbi:MAG: VCBS repeat-containing protein [Colwellia sp.]|nr:VCBS repeat-containing protein [Colwellia sp.]